MNATEKRVREPSPRGRRVRFAREDTDMANLQLKRRWLLFLEGFKSIPVLFADRQIPYILADILPDRIQSFVIVVKDSSFRRARTVSFVSGLLLLRFFRSNEAKHNGDLFILRVSFVPGVNQPDIHC